MHSVKSSLKFQLDIDVSIDILSNMIINEALLNQSDYLSSTGDNNVNNLMNELFDYITRKRCELWFGDFVPTIMANALDVNIVIIEMDRTHIRFNKVGRNADNPSILLLVVLKLGEHNDGLIYLHSRKCHKPPMDGHICESFEFGNCAPNDIIYCSNELTHHRLSCSTNRMLQIIIVIAMLYQIRNVVQWTGKCFLDYRNMPQVRDYLQCLPKSKLFE